MNDLDALRLRHDERRGTGYCDWCGLDEVRLSQALLRIHPAMDGWAASKEAADIAREYAALRGEDRDR